MLNLRRSTTDKIKGLGLDPALFTTDGSKSLEGRVILVDPKLYGKDKASCLFLATGGFGCSPDARGSCIFATRLSDGLQGRVKRHEVVAALARDLSDKGPYATGEDEGIAKERQATVAQVRFERAADDKPAPDAECPNCRNGTVGLERGRLVCRGECGTDFGKA